MRAPVGTIVLVLSGTVTVEAMMIKPRIFVTGATGKTGSVVAAELLKAGYRVRAWCVVKTVVALGSERAGRGGRRSPT